METLKITYTFYFPDQRQETIEVCLEPETLAPVGQLPAVLPEWTRLDFHQCEHCPLNIQTDPQCPLAARLVELVNSFEGILSFEELRVEVVTEERTVTKEVPAQQAVSSLMGLVMATSGCPHMAFFKPMARFHLPLASTEETIYRASSMYLLAQYFLQKAGKEPDVELEGLKEIYRDLETLNTHMAERIRAAISKDAAVNAIVILDFFAKDLSFAIEDQLEEMQPLFDSYLGSGESDA